MRRPLAALLALSVLAAAAPARAGDGKGDEAATAVDWPSYWARGAARPFVSAMIDVGLLYFRPRLAAGVGRPHHSWIGLEANPLISGEAVGGWAGLRGALPFADLRLGARYQYAFRRSFLLPQPTYSRDEILNREGPHSSYVSLEAELSGYLPAGPGLVLFELAGTAVQGVEEGHYVYEETIRVVLNPPFVWRVRAGYALRLPPLQRLSVGAVLEVVGVPGRDQMAILRGGLVVRLRLFDQLEARGTFVPVLYSKDALGADGADTFLVGIRYRWATGLRHFL